MRANRREATDHEPKVDMVTGDVSSEDGSPDPELPPLVLETFWPGVREEKRVIEALPAKLID